MVYKFLNELLILKNKITQKVIVINLGKMSGELCPPLLVRIQSIEISSLDFQCGTPSASKARHVTHVEATNLFLFVGCTSGTVYVFSRDSLKFLFIIPFKGGKVCNISVTLDESDVAVASIRGKVSIYRIAPNVHLLQSSKVYFGGSSSSPGEAFRHMYDVPHHVQREITEIQWSPNGKYLFIGDSQGDISQVDVASLEEFPRPPPSSIILKLKSRILQIDCTFPYMAVCTLTAVYLCDLEKEDFTRIKTIDRKNSDVRSAGISLMVLPDPSENTASLNPAANNKPTKGKLNLFVGEVGTGSMYQCSMDGTVTSYKKVELAPEISKNSVTLFDPKVPIDPQVLSSRESSQELNFCLGKMLSTDDGLLVSVSSDRIFVYDPYTTNIILWNEDFNRINSFKIIANYGFVWHGNKLDVLAFTPFRSYAKQLLKAGLKSVLESWIIYAVYSLGWKDVSESNSDGNTQETQIANSESVLEEISTEGKNNTPKISEENKSTIKLFKRVMSPIDDEDDFCNFVASRVPFELIKPKIVPVVEETNEMRFEKALDKLNSSFQLLSSTEDKPNAENIFTLWNLIEIFYTELGAMLPHLNFKKSELTISKVLLSIHAFLRQPQLINLKDDVLTIKKDTRIFDDIIKFALKCFSNKKLFQIQSSDETSSFSKLPFTKYAQCPVVLQYFKDLGISADSLLYDAILADTIILLQPLTSEEFFLNTLNQPDSPKIYERISHLFFTWIVLVTFCSSGKFPPLPYGSLLRNLQNEQFFDKLAEDILFSVYRDVMNPQSGDDGKSIILQNQNLIPHPAKYFHHFITFVVLFSKSPNLKPRGVNIILILFPLKREVKKDIIEKVIQICRINPFLLQLYHKACMEDGHSMKLCDCGIQARFGTLEEAAPSFQRAIEEAILLILIDNYLENQIDILSTSSAKTESHTLKDLAQTPVHSFAMKRCLIEPYMESSVCDEIVSDHLKIQMLLRSGACNALKHLKFTLENLKIIRNYVKNCDKMEKKKCIGCGYKLKKVNLPNSTVPKSISIDCVGVWMVENAHSIDRFMKLVRKMNMNSSGEFSLSFYRFLIKRDHLRKGKKEDAGFGDLVSLSSLTCSVLH